MEFSVSITSESDDEYRIILSPQKFRSDLFSRMFDRYIISNGITNIINTPIEIKADRHIYIHLISRKCHLKYVTAIKNAIMDMEAK